jgi:CelD/BcsL family acetyltransferase involved in cellulose biosynthesis
MTPKIVWREEALRDPARITALAQEARETFPHLDWHHDVVQLSERQDVLVMSARLGGRLVGLAALPAEMSYIRFGLNYLTVARKRVRRYALEREPLLCAEVRSEAMASFFEALATRLDDDAAFFLPGVPDGSLIHDLLSDCHGRISSKFHIVPQGPSYLRCRVRWNGDFEAYLESLGKATRKDLRRTLKKAETQFGAAYRLERFTTVADVPRFQSLASDVAEKTYQRRLLAQGITNSEADRTELVRAARAGRLLGHVLFIADEPVAFHLGHIDGGCLSMTDGGYDPKWAKAQVGMLTYLLMLKDLEAHRVPVTILDYSYGGGVYKERTSHVKTPERHYYLIKRSMIGTAVATAMRTTDAASRGVGQMLERYRLKDWMRRQIRRLHEWGAGWLAAPEAASLEVVPMIV